MNKLGILDWIAFILVIIGGLNWGLVGLMDINLVMEVFGTGMFAKVIYDLVGLSAIYLLIISPKLRK